MADQHSKWAVKLQAQPVIEELLELRPRLHPHPVRGPLLLSCLSTGEESP
jgi:hypothetical protein